MTAIRVDLQDDVLDALRLLVGRARRIGISTWAVLDQHISFFAHSVTLIPAGGSVMTPKTFLEMRVNWRSSAALTAWLDQYMW